MKTIHIFGWGRLYCNLAKRCRRGWERPERCSLGAWPPPTECDFEGPHSKIVQRAWMCNHGFRPISLSPCIYPRLLLSYCNLTEESFSTWRWWVHIKLLTNKSLFSRLHMMHAMTSPVSGLDLSCQKIFSKILANETSIMMWMRTCGQIHTTGLIKKKKCSEEYSSWHFIVDLL